MILAYLEKIKASYEEVLNQKTGSLDLLEREMKENKILLEQMQQEMDEKIDAFSPRSLMEYEPSRMEELYSRQVIIQNTVSDLEKEIQEQEEKLKEIDPVLEEARGLEETGKAADHKEDGEDLLDLFDERKTGGTVLDQLESCRRIAVSSPHQCRKMLDLIIEEMKNRKEA